MNHFLHGADYNPEQWIDTPEVWDDDVRLMKLAGCNVMSVGIFSWSMLEKEEGVFDFSWLDQIIDKLWKNGVSVILATPSGARPAWLSQRYPEVLRVRENRLRNLHGGRHNHCFTSPVYRKKTQEINTRLAERYKDHPAILLWHVSNEYSGECYCELCQNAFREWLKRKYNYNLDELNKQWWTNFWSHKYTNWEQIEPPASQGENSIHALVLDWKRFITDQTIDFMKNEVAPLKRITPNIPVTANFMYAFEPLDYFKFAEVLDVASWDAYPEWHKTSDNTNVAASFAFVHDQMRGILNKPFLLMESTPSIVNWKNVNKQKRPGMHFLSSMQAVAHGSDSVQYFQWRKSRGSVEKFHGAVVSHCGGEFTRTFKDVSQVGEGLQKLKEIAGTMPQSEVAIVLDWENWWAINEFRAARMDRKSYFETCVRHYQSFWKNGISVDIIDSTKDFSKYKLIVAPMLYMIKQGVAEKIDNYVSSGGQFVTTYLSGLVNENDLCFLGGFPVPLNETLGLWSEELDALYDDDENYIVMNNSKEYRIKELCEVIHTTTAKVLGTYKSDYYANTPVVTQNMRGNGSAYYIAARDCGEFTDDFYSDLADTLNLKRVIAKLPESVTAQSRYGEGVEYIFLQNYSDLQKEVTLDSRTYTDMITGEEYKEQITLPAYGCKILNAVLV